MARRTGTPRVCRRRTPYRPPVACTISRWRLWVKAVMATWASVCLRRGSTWTVYQVHTYIHVYYTLYWVLFNVTVCIIGWDKHSYGYHGDDGHSFCSSGTGQPYGPTFTTGDVIGCGVNLIDNTCFYTKNGHHLGIAFTDRSAGAHIHAYTYASIYVNVWS